MAKNITGRKPHGQEKDGSRGERQGNNSLFKKMRASLFDNLTSSYVPPAGGYVQVFPGLYVMATAVQNSGEGKMSVPHNITLKHIDEVIDGRVATVSPLREVVRTSKRKGMKIDLRLRMNNDLSVNALGTKLKKGDPIGSFDTEENGVVKCMNGLFRIRTPNGDVVDVYIGCIWDDGWHLILKEAVPNEDDGFVVFEGNRYVKKVPPKPPAKPQNKTLSRRERIMRMEGQYNSPISGNNGGNSESNGKKGNGRNGGNGKGKNVNVVNSWETKSNAIGRDVEMPTVGDLFSMVIATTNI